MSDAIQVLLVDDKPAVRWLLRSTFEPDARFEIVGEAADGREAVAVAEATHPDLAVMDLAMPNVDGLQAIDAIRRTSPETRIVVLSGHASSMQEQVLAHGAEGCVQKGGEPEVLFREIARLFPDVLGAVEDASAAAPEPPPSPDPHLSFLIHEMHNALTVIGGFAATLRAAGKRMDPEAVLACAEPIERNARELATLINGLPEAIAESVRAELAKREPGSTYALDRRSG
jgi:CheY-like chemotaxis protein